LSIFHFQWSSKKPVIEEKPIPVDLEPKEVHSQPIFHFRGSATVEKMPAVEEASCCGKPIPVDLEAKKVHSLPIFHFHDEKTAIEPPPVVKEAGFKN
jgi:hypothetical protein